MHYRGYGQSEVHHLDPGIYDDSVSAIEYIIQNPQSTPQQRVYFRSKSGGVNAIVAIAKLHFPPEQVLPCPLGGFLFLQSGGARYEWARLGSKKIGNIRMPFYANMVIFFFFSDQSPSPMGL